MDTTKSASESLGDIALQLIALPFVLLWAIVKGFVVGALAVLTFGLIT